MRVALLRSFVNFVLLVFKLMAGIWGHSSAMIANAVHSLSDFITDIIVLLFVNISSKPKGRSHDYGHGKYETLATSIAGIVLLCVGFGPFWEGANEIYDFYFKRIPLGSPGVIVLVAVLISIVIRELLYHITIWMERKQNSQVVIANTWRHRSDAFPLIGTALGIEGAILLGNNWYVLDPLAAVVISLFIVKVALQLVIPAIDDLLEKSLSKEVEDEILTIINEVLGVKSPHSLHTRRIDNNLATEAHIRVNGQTIMARTHDSMKEIEQSLRDKFGQTTHTALYVEPIK